MHDNKSQKRFTIVHVNNKNGKIDWVIIDCLFLHSNIEKTEKEEVLDYCNC